jgi:hypothetical protein
MPARGAELAFRDRQWNVAKELEASQIDARAAWKTEVGRLYRRCRRRGRRVADLMQGYQLT